MRRRFIFVLFGSMLALAACAGSTATQPTPTPAPSPSSMSGPFLAVVQHYDSGPQGAAVALVRPDGTVAARATFQPRQRPYAGNVAVMLRSEAQAGRRGVYYADGNGVVRLLEPTGKVTVVATFAMTPVQHELWYAVSPDGGRLLAGILTLPDVVPGQPFPTLSGTWKFDLASATAGGGTTVLQHVESATAPADPQGSSLKPIFPVGWTSAGPVAMVGAPIATQNLWVGGPLYTIDESGKPATRVGGADATSASILPSGILPAVTGQGSTVTVRDSAGAVQWQPAVDGYNALNLRLAPGGDAITDGLHAVTRQGAFAVPDRFHAAGWLDATTLVGGPYADRTDVAQDLWYVTNQGGAAVVHHLGVIGEFEGVVPGA